MIQEIRNKIWKRCDKRYRITVSSDKTLNSSPYNILGIQKL